MKSRKLSFVLIILFLAAYIFGGNAEKVNASVITFGDYEFDESTKTITKYNGTSSNLVIPEKINNIEVENIGDFSFDGCTSIKELVIPSNIKKIGIYSFRDCINISKLTLEEGVQEIDRGAFFNSCKEAEEIIIPGSVNSIGEDTFGQCEGLKKVEIYNGVKKIGANAFESCANLSEITIPSSVESIGDKAFQHCYYLKSLNIGEGIKNIGKYAFNECSIGEINIPSSVQSVGEYAFWNSGAAKIWVNKSTQTEENAFGLWDEPSTIYITGNPTENEMDITKANFMKYKTFDSVKFVGILCKEDINNDKVVGIDDLANVAASYNVKRGNSNYKSEIDINGDGIIDIYDLIRVARKM
ncbi:leucine-rich repeat protein [Clostridium sp. SHJSY1]|uniref:leucine-rich repeat protein n=1 Tax=Clostridium sp. SHJSY1 TaxID=2942483 RepID=UPI0028746E2E|nr:leucine-rich repeat protein [Clostridium sp. SHJSY1]MDS0525560.1 leucine-rich repeat protein [Clostridium sp. SHJSY1]